MARISVALPDDLLAAIVAEAGESRVPRDVLIRQALLSFLDSRRRARDERSQRRLEEAVRAVEEYVEKLRNPDRT
ncbi:MAG: ribbon-helix-helix protein, CopG family [Acidobacteria bacterium]|nr:ribbon-helix-helix protein, CopG family [Acidobacteriota bacterium]